MKIILSVFAETNIMTGKKGGNITLPCKKHGANPIFRIIKKCKNENGKIDTVCDNKECSEQEKSGVILKNLSFSDAWRYTLIIYYDDGQTVLEPHTTEYRLQIYGKVKNDQTISMCFFKLLHLFPQSKICAYDLDCTTQL